MPEPFHHLATIAQDGGTTTTTTPAEPLVESLPSLDDGCGENASWVCEQVLEWTGSDRWAAASEWFVAKPVTLVLIAVGAWVVSRILRTVVKRSIERSMLGGEGHVRRNLRRVRAATVDVVAEAEDTGLRAEARANTMITVSRGIVTLTVWFVAVLIMLAVIGIDLAPLLAGAGILGVALGFGMQDLVKDFVAGTFIIFEDQYGVGDVVDLGEATGTVEKMTLRITSLRDLDGNVWHVPNGEIQRVANKSQEWARALLDVEVAYDTDLDEARDVIQRTAEVLSADDDWSDVVLDAPEVWGVENLGADAVSLRLVIKTLPGEQWKVLRELRRRLKTALDEAGIEIPFPQRTVWVRTEAPPDDGA